VKEHYQMGQESGEVQVLVDFKTTKKNKQKTKNNELWDF
jgi:hypothetical protein